IRSVAMGEDCISPATHRAISTPLQMMAFITEMRRLSGGKPTGFKMCVGHAWVLFAICKTMLETGIYPDLMVVDGNDGGTGAAPLKTERVYMYHHATLHALSERLAAAGLDHPQQLRPIHFSKRTSSTEVMSFAKLYPSLRPGELIEGTQDPRFRDAWAMARADSFQPVG